jgi:hypothetical protein
MWTPFSRSNSPMLDHLIAGQVDMDVEAEQAHLQ